MKGVEKMNNDLKEIADTMILRFNREVARALRINDHQALQRASEIRAEINGFMSACYVLEEREVAKYCRNWLEHFYE